MAHERIFVSPGEYRQLIAQLVVKARKEGLDVATLMHDTTRLMGYFQDGGVDNLRDELNRLRDISETALEFVMQVESEGDAILTDGMQRHFDRLCTALGRDEEEPDTSDIPEAGPEFFEKARLTVPEADAAVAAMMEEVGALRLKVQIEERRCEKLGEQLPLLRAVRQMAYVVIKTAARLYKHDVPTSLAIAIANLERTCNESQKGSLTEVEVTDIGGPTLQDKVQNAEKMHRLHAIERCARILVETNRDFGADERRDAVSLLRQLFGLDAEGRPPVPPGDIREHDAGDPRPTGE